MYCQNCGAFLGQETQNNDWRSGQDYDTDGQDTYGRQGRMYTEREIRTAGRKRTSGREKEKGSGDGVIKFLIGLTAVFAVTAVSFAVCRVVTGKYPLELLDRNDEPAMTADNESPETTTAPAEAAASSAESSVSEASAAEQTEESASAPAVTAVSSKPASASALAAVSSKPASASVAAVGSSKPASASAAAVGSGKPASAPAGTTENAGTAQVNALPTISLPDKMTDSPEENEVASAGTGEAEKAASEVQINQVGSVSFTGLAGNVTPAAPAASTTQSSQTNQPSGAAAGIAGGAAGIAGGAAAGTGTAAGTESMNIEDIEAAAAAAGQAAAPAEDNSPVEMRLISANDANLAGQSLIGITAAAASSTISQSGTANDPILVFDRRDETSWQEGVSGYGLGEWLKASFDGNYKVKYMAFKLGNWKNDKYYYGNGKPKTLEILIGDFRGEITFPDERAVQWVEFSKEVDANAMEITIRDVYAGTSWQDPCIAAVDVYGSYAGMP